MNVPLTTRRLHALRLTTLAFLLQQLWLPAHATPAQSPLINSPEGKPLPNLMLTFDESGSMTQGYLPEGKFTVGTFPNISFGIQGPRYLFAHPQELKKNRFTGATNTIFNKTAWDDSIFITSVPIESQNDLIVGKDRADLVLQYQSRSPQVNQIYYNPAIKYKPWTGITKEGVVYNFNVPNPQYARLDPLAYDAKEFSEVPNRPELPFTALKSSGGSTYPPGWVDTTSLVDLTTDLSMPDKTPGYRAKWHSLINRDRTGEPTVMNRPYSPALLYMLIPGLNPGSTGSYIYYNLNTPDGTTYPRYIDRSDCQDVINPKTGAPESFCKRDIEIQNYTNWFVFYRSRLFIAQGALPDALLPLSNQFRMGWGGLHPGVTRDPLTKLPSDGYNNSGTNLVDGVASSTVHQGVRDWTADQKYALTQWLRVLKTYGGTPTRQATQSVTDYFKRSDGLSPWSSIMTTEKGSPSSDHLRCRRAYNVVLTDGYYNEPSGITLTSNVDGDSGLGYPFKDESTKTLADYAMYSWNEDLQGDKSNPGPDSVKPITVPPKSTSADDVLLASIKSDPATYRHLTQFYMGFGLTGNLLTNEVLSSEDAYNKTLLALAKCGQTGGVCWNTFDPDKTSSTADIIDDIWHAAINSRGQFFNINSPKSVKESINAIVNRSSSDVFKEAGLATASSTLSAGNIKFVPEYTPYTWSGTIKAYELDAQGQVVGATPGEKATPKWNAEDIGGETKPRVLPLPAARNIFVYQSPSSAVALADSGLDKELAGLTGFLRGEAGNGTLRQRDPQHMLPDFINSTPLYVKEGSNLGYSDSGYSAYYGSKNTEDSTKSISGKSTRANGLLFVGSNGGMTHAFNTATGQEVFAYIPSGALGDPETKPPTPSKLSLIAQQTYGYPDNPHQYVVDGQFNESDALIGEDGKEEWRNLVVGTMGAGGKSIFAFQLDALDPLSNLNSNTVLWDVTSDDVGYITSTPQIGRLPNGKFRVFVGNGVDSKNGKVALLAIDPYKGNITAIYVGSSGPGPQSDTNAGLGGITLVKDKTTGYVTAIYAGDTLGRLWRFDVNADSSITVGYQGQQRLQQTDEAKTLITAKDDKNVVQPILAAPLVYPHPLGGQLITFNTGRLLYEIDGSSNQLQSAYGIWDKIPTGKSTAQEAAPDIQRGDLQQQTINKRIEVKQAGTENKTATFFELSSNAITWANTTNDTTAPTTDADAKMGWVLDLKVPDTVGDKPDSWSYPKAIYDPRRFGNSMAISALTPGKKVESCTDSKAQGYSFLIKALNGGQQTIVPAIDTDGNGRFTTDDILAGGALTTGGAGNILTGDRETVVVGEEANKKSVDCTNGSRLDVEQGRGVRDCEPSSGNSKYSVKDRIWRQLFNPPHP